MRNLTNYDDQFILYLIEQAKGNPYKCTANVQYSVGFNKLIPMLVIYQDASIGWNDEYVTIKNTMIQLLFRIVLKILSMSRNVKSMKELCMKSTLGISMLDKWDGNKTFIT